MKIYLAVDWIAQIALLRMRFQVEGHFAQIAQVSSRRIPRKSLVWVCRTKHSRYVISQTLLGYLYLIIQHPFMPVPPHFLLPPVSDLSGRHLQRVNDLPGTVERDW